MTASPQFEHGIILLVKDDRNVLVILNGPMKHIVVSAHLDAHGVHQPFICVFVALYVCTQVVMSILYKDLDVFGL